VSAPWSPEHAERHLRSLELFGMRFGLDRMRRMMTVLGSPERSFETIHVVGTNGKTSTTRMIAAILENHGLRTGSYTSPHLMSYTERVQISGREVETHAFAAAIARAAWAAERVNRTLAEDDHVTQFELLTAAAFWELARRGTQVVVVEAGLGGRYDATNVIDSTVVAFTNVGLEHTRWLGPRLRDIATEKLAVVGEGSVLVLGAFMDSEVLELARAKVAEQGARLLLTRPAPRGVGLGARGSFQQANFALARLAAAEYLARSGLRLEQTKVEEAGALTTVPGRMQVVAGDPLTVLDGAHNPAAVVALAESLPELLGGRALGLVMGVLEDKDAAGMLAVLLPLCERAWFTAPPSRRALSPAALESLAWQLGFERSTCEPNPARALKAARDWARTREPGGAVLASGSIYLIGDLMGCAGELGLDLGADTPSESNEPASRAERSAEA
jgi:dihydrofolate synthase / folylpolyglutamate synthase